MLTRTRPLSLLLVLAVLLAACGENGPLPIGGSPTPVPPREVAVVVVDAATGDPIPGATITADGEELAADDTGAATLTAFVDDAVEATADGYEDGAGTVPADGELRIELRDNTLEGTVTDEAGAAAGRGRRVRR